MSLKKKKGDTFYWVYGEKTDMPDIVMVHGFRGTHHGLELITSNIKNHRVIIPDLPGFGETKPIEGTIHTLETYVEWLANFIDGLNLKQKPILMGHSFGSIVVSHFAVKYGDKIKCLILENPISDPALKGPKAFATILAIIYYWLGFKSPEKIGHKILSSRFVINIMTKIMSKTKDKKIKDYAKDQHLKHFSSFYDRKFLEEVFKTSIGNNVIEVASKIKLPTLIIAGEKDDITSLKTQIKLSKIIKNSKLEIVKNTGHLTQYEEPKKVAGAIEAFSDQLN